MIFEVQVSAGIQTVACLKHLNQNGTVNCSPYLYGAVQSVEAERQVLPISRDFTHLQQQLLATLLPYPLQVSECLSDAIERNQTINRFNGWKRNCGTSPYSLIKRVELNKGLKSAKQILMAKSTQ